LPLLSDYNCAIANFDLWMSKGAHDVFVLVMNFLGFDWKPKHVTFGLFELLDAYGLRNKIITYVKDEGSNLIKLTNVLKSIVKYETLGLEKKIQGTCFGHVFSRTC